MRTVAAVVVATALAGAVVLRLGSGPDERAAAEGDDAQKLETAAATPFRYDVEYPFIDYSTSPRSDRVADLRRQLADGGAQLQRHRTRGYLDSLLEALEIDPASQVLVFSATSLQADSIRPRTPRAIYFNDEVYVAWVQSGGPIEIAAMDPRLGPVFYTLEQSEGAGIETRVETCLRCHDSFSLTGGGTPRFIVGSGYIGPRGNIVAHEGWILTTQRTPLRNRLGGWYVTGRHPNQQHLGNVVVRDIADLERLDALRVDSLDSLDGRVDMSRYIAPGSDIVALLVMQHQIDVQNRIARVGYLTRALLAERGPSTGERADSAFAARVAEIAEPLVEALLFVDEAPLSGPIEGSSPFRSRFEQRGPTDRQGRSLRRLDLERRLMHYPLSYLVYSAAFGALPAPAKSYVQRRIAQVLRGQDEQAKFDHLSAEDREAVIEILADTHPELSAALGQRTDGGQRRAAAP